MYCHQCGKLLPEWQEPEPYPWGFVDGSLLSGLYGRNLNTSIKAERGLPFNWRPLLHFYGGIMLITHPRANEIGINTDISAYSVSNNDLFKAIADEVDLETVTNHELREIFFIVRKQLSHLNWRDMVTYAVNHLPFGLNQTQFAWDGHKPCEGCPDAMIENGRCYHDQECKAMEIYDARF